jgi:hypothetical protein
MRKYLTINEEVKLVIYGFATNPFCISLYMRKFLFSFLSGHEPDKGRKFELFPLLLLQVEQRNPGADDNNLNSIFYEHLTRLAMVDF